MSAAGFCPAAIEAAREQGLDALDLRTLTVGELVDFLQHELRSGAHPPCGGVGGASDTEPAPRAPASAAAGGNCLADVIAGVDVGGGVEPSAPDAAAGDGVEGGWEEDVDLAVQDVVDWSAETLRTLEGLNRLGAAALWGADVEESVPALDVHVLLLNHVADARRAWVLKVMSAAGFRRVELPHSMPVEDVDIGALEKSGLVSPDWKHFDEDEVTKKRYVAHALDYRKGCVCACACARARACVDVCLCACMCVCMRACRRAQSRLAADKPCRTCVAGEPCRPRRHRHTRPTRRPGSVSSKTTLSSPPPPQSHRSVSGQRCSSYRPALTLSTSSGAGIRARPPASTRHAM